MRDQPTFAPVVLAHGLFGFDRIGLGPMTLVSYFRDVPRLLRRGGRRVVVTRVHPTAGIARRARVLAERIGQALGPDEPFHLIGHSMGGLDARALAARPEWSARLLSVTTVGTPHLGSTLADAARLRMGPVYRLLARVGLDHGGFADLTRRAARDWHATMPEPDGVPCFSLAGDPPADQVAWPLRRLHAHLKRWEGPNDGLVSVDSALAFGTPIDPFPIDHLGQMGWTRVEPSRTWVYGLYETVLDRLDEVEVAAEVGGRLAAVG